MWWITVLQKTQHSSSHYFSSQPIQYPFIRTTSSHSLFQILIVFLCVVTHIENQPRSLFFLIVYLTNVFHLILATSNPLFIVLSCREMRRFSLYCLVSVNHLHIRSMSSLYQRDPSRSVIPLRRIQKVTTSINEWLEEDGSAPSLKPMSSAQNKYYDHFGPIQSKLRDDWRTHLLQ